MALVPLWRPVSQWDGAAPTFASVEILIMNLQQLRYVRAIEARGLNLREAAEHLHTSQSGVSRQIRELEIELGIVIFTRHGKRFTGLTDVGKGVLHHAKTILTETDNLRRLAAEHAARESGRLIVATTHNQARFALPDSVERFVRQHPEVSFELRQGMPHDVANWVATGEADIGIASESVANHPDLYAPEAYGWHHSIIAPVGHALSDVPIRSLKDLDGLPIITYRKGISGRESLDQAFERAGFAPKIILSAMDSDIIFDYVARGLGLGIVADFTMPAIGTGWQRLNHPLHLFPRQSARIALARGSKLRTYAYRFITFVAPHLSEAHIEQELDQLS
jgi:DNA-binding transcriptional LysR family regulator